MKNTFQAGMQAVRQAGRQASRHAGKQAGMQACRQAVETRLVRMYLMFNYRQGKNLSKRNISYHLVASN